MKTTTFNPVQTAVKMLTEWTPEQFKAMEKAIARHFKNKKVKCFSGRGFNYYHFKTFKGVDEIFGLAYTSSGLFACYGVCNVQPLIDADGIYHYSYFAIGGNGKFYAILQDKDENELCIEL